jgi:hypothetical protein
LDWYRLMVNEAPNSELHVAIVPGAMRADTIRAVSSAPLGDVLCVKTLLGSHSPI